MKITVKVENILNFPTYSKLYRLVDEQTFLKVVTFDSSKTFLILILQNQSLTCNQ